MSETRDLERVPAHVLAALEALEIVDCITEPVPLSHRKAVARKLTPAMEAMADAAADAITDYLGKHSAKDRAAKRATEA